MEVLSMEVDPLDSDQSDYRIRIGSRVKYLSVDPGTCSYEIRRFPPEILSHLPKLPDGDWTRARVFRSEDNTVNSELSYAILAGVTDTWHANLVDILSLKRVDSFLSMRVKEVEYASTVAVAKIARFEFEIPWLRNETDMYQLIDGHGIGPKFLGHLTEEGRVMGILLEKLEGRPGAPEDLEACREAVGRLHALGIVHGDLNRFNFLICADGVKIIDFENSNVGRSKAEMEDELSQLKDQLEEETGRGGLVEGWGSDTD